MTKKEIILLSDEREIEKLSSDEDKILIAGVISVIFFALMLFAQMFTPEYLNLFGCTFALISICSGMYAVMGTLFIWTELRR